MVSFCIGGLAEWLTPVVQYFPTDYGRCAALPLYKAEESHSGLVHWFRKPAGVKIPREFKSLLLRFVRGLETRWGGGNSHSFSCTLRRQKLHHIYKLLFGSRASKCSLVLSIFVCNFYCFSVNQSYGNFFISG